MGRDLLLARQNTEGIHIFSLEGCVQRGFLPRRSGMPFAPEGEDPTGEYLSRLKDFNWDAAAAPPKHMVARVQAARRLLRALLWISAHPWLLLAGAVAGLYCRKRR